MALNQEKNQLLEMEPEIKEIIELSNIDVKQKYFINMFHIFKIVEEKMNMMMIDIGAI